MGAAPGPVQVATGLLYSVGAGIACGLGVAWIAGLLAGRSGDPLVETTFSVVTAYGSFLLAEHFGGSGVIATLCAGLLFGRRGPGSVIAPRDRDILLSFWTFVAFVANSLVFLLVGCEPALAPASLRGWMLPLAIVVTLVSRAVNVYPIALLFRSGPLRVEPGQQHLLVWGGLRGALALALALGLPAGFALREDILQATGAVVVFSVLVQGASFPRLLARRS